jgi:hypothetical protein
VSNGTPATDQCAASVQFPSVAFIVLKVVACAENAAMTNVNAARAPVILPDVFLLIVFSFLFFTVVRTRLTADYRYLLQLYIIIGRTSQLIIFQIFTPEFHAPSEFRH